MAMFGIESFCIFLAAIKTMGTYWINNSVKLHKFEQSIKTKCEKPIDRFITKAVERLQGTLSKSNILLIRLRKYSHLNKGFDCKTAINPDRN